MYIKKLKLINFRNYEKLDIEFDKNINIFYGFNAQGKTNILESLYFMGCGRSHRTNKDKELINMNYDECFMETLLEKKNNETKIDVKIDRTDKKIIKINNIPIKKMGELMGNLNVVMFSPEDLKIIKEGPSERRRFIDILISQIKPNYFYNLQQYYKIIHNRNALLRDIKKNRSLINTLFLWDNNIVEIGSKIIYYRNAYINKISKYIKPIHKNISEEEIFLNYKPNIQIKDFNNIELIKEQLLKNLNKNIENDIVSGITSVGPHRDDFEVSINNINTKNFASQGQQRTAALTLKLAEIEIIKEEIGEYPILLLDDVMSEIDDKRQDFLFSSLKGIQVFITCTSEEKYREKEASFYNVSNGIIKKN